MGFLSNIRKGMKKQIRPNNMMIGNIRKMPRRPDISDIFGRGSFLFGRRPRGNMGSDFRMPQKRSGLGELLRRLQEQIRNQQPIPERMPSVDDGRMYAGGSPGLYKPGGRFYNPGARLQMPQPIPRAEIDISALERLPMGDMPMTQDLPEVAPIGMMPQKMRMGGMQDMEPRMMMQEGEDVSLERELFSLQSQLKNLEEQLRLDRSYNDDQAVINTSAEMAAIQKRIQEIMEGRPQLAGGGDFPDLTGDGKVTQADILKGRGVYAEGDEVMMMEETEMMAPGGDEIEASLMEVQGMQPETQMLDQYVQMVIEMVQAGASEAEVIESLRQAGLDDDDIAAVFQAVMETLQGSMEQGGIDAELAQLS